MIKEKKMITTEYWVVGTIDRPVKVIHDPNGVFIYAYNWQTGKFEVNNLIGNTIYASHGVVSRLSEDEFEQYVENLRECLTMDTPAYYNIFGSPRKAERDEEGRLHVIGFNAMTGEMNYELTTYDIGIGTGEARQAKYRITKQEYDECVADLKRMWKERIKLKIDR